MAYFSTYRDFPFCFIEGEVWDRTWNMSNGAQVSHSGKVLVGPGTFFPIGLTYERFFEVYYRIKLYSLKASSNIGVLTTGLEQSSIAPTVDDQDDFSDYLDATTTSNLPSEASFACNWPIASIGIIRATLASGISKSENKTENDVQKTSFISPRARINLFNASSQAAPFSVRPFTVYVADGLYYPSMPFFLYTGGEATVEGREFLSGPSGFDKRGASNKSISTISPAQYGNFLAVNGGASWSSVTSTREEYRSVSILPFEIEFLGESFDALAYVLQHTLNYTTRPTPEEWLHVEGFSNASLTSIRIEIEALEYWPYDPGDTDPYDGKDGSGPIYDPATGAQLRDPFSVDRRGDGTFYNPKYTP